MSKASSKDRAEYGELRPMPPSQRPTRRQKTRATKSGGAAPVHADNEQGHGWTTNPNRKPRRRKESR